MMEDISQIVVLGFHTTKEATYMVAGVFGGFFPLLFDLIQSHNRPQIERITRDRLYWCVKAFLIPLGAFVITVLCISSGGITNWFAALYLGATLPVLIGKLMAINEKSVDLPPGA